MAKRVAGKFGGGQLAQVDLSGLRIHEVESQVRDAMWEGLAKGADIVAENASTRAPVGETGKLAKSIVSNRIGKYNIPAVFTTSGYGGHVETGTSRQSAQPFIRPALKANADKIGDLVRDAVRKVR